MKMRRLVALVMAALMLCCIIPFTAVAADSSATIDFTDLANRTAYSTEQQVWEQNGIIVTNDKGASTSNVGDYGGEGYPARFYKSSTVKIEYPGMTKIVIDCTGLDAKYVNGWADSFSANATATVDGTTITIVLAEPADSFTWEQLTAQARAYNITVYTGDAGDAPVVPPVEPDEPEVPDVPVEPDEPEIPDVPVEPDDEIDTTIPYMLGMVQENVSTEDVYFINGLMNGYYMDTTTDVSSAIVVKLEETDGGYYLYTVLNDAKTYINMVVSGTHVNGAYESAPSTVYTYDWDRYTLVSEVNGELYAFGTRNDKTYTTMGPVKVSYNGFHADLYYFGDGSDCDHDYELLEEIAPTCGEDGVILYACTICGETFVDTTPATGEHTYDDDYDAYCNVCGEMREVPDVPVYVGGIATSANSGAIGEKVVIGIHLDVNPGIISAKVKVHFDNTVLKLVEATPGEFSEVGYSWGDIAAANEKGYFIVNWCDATQPNSMAQVLATLTFEILETAQVGEMYSIYPEFDCQADIFNFDDETVWFYAVSGGVFVVEKVAVVEGDVNGDGKVNNRDLGILQKYLNGSDVVVDEVASDLSGDGKLNNRDLGLLQKKLNA